MRTIATVTALLLCFVVAAASPPLIAPGEGCGCEYARLNNAWCRACGVGYVAGVPICSASLHEALDPHGHDCDPAVMRCPGCREAFRTSGMCEEHRVGYEGGRLYASRLTWTLAKGTPFRVSDLSCATCAAKARRLIAYASGESPLAPGERLDGWCEECEVGMVGNVAFCSRARYEAALVEFQRLATLVETSRRCERCAAAQFFGTHCSICNIRYDESGKAIKE